MASCTPRKAFQTLRDHSYPVQDEIKKGVDLVEMAEALDERHVKLAWFGPHYAAYEQETPMVHDLTFRGKSSAIVDAVLALIRRGEEFGIQPDLPDYAGRSLMHHAAMNASGAQFIERLTMCNVQLCDNEGETPVMLAALQDKRLDCLKALYNRGASLIYLPPSTCPMACCRNLKPESALLMAIKARALENVRYLVQNGALPRLNGEWRPYREAAVEAGSEFAELICPAKRRK